jgi:hypothetical protein
VRALEALGYSYRSGEWLPPAAVTGAVGAPLPFTVEADAMHGMLMLRADALAGCTESSGEETELQAIVDLLEAYEARSGRLARSREELGRVNNRSYFLVSASVSARRNASHPALN